MAVRVIRKFRLLFDVNFGTPNDGDVPTYDAGTDKLIMAAPTGGGGGGPPSGPAGGVLGGTYPDPSFAVDMATQAEVDTAIATAISGLVDTAPGTLDTLNELAAALGDDPNFATTVTNELAGKQPLDQDLTSIAGLSPSNDDIIQRKAGAWTNRTIAQLLADLGLGSVYQAKDTTLDTYAGIDPSANVQSVLSAADYSAIRTLLGLVVGADVQAYDLDLAAFAGLAIAADKLPYGTGSHTLGLTDLSAFIRTVLDDSDAATARATLGVIASLFQSGGAQAIGLDTLAATGDNSNLNASASAHGLLPKLDNNAAHYLDGTGAWSTPPGGSTSKTVTLLVSDPAGSAITVGDGKTYWTVPATFNGLNLTAVEASVTTVSSSGLPTVQLRRLRLTNPTTQSAADMLTTKVSIDASEFNSKDATTAAVIDTSNDDVQTGDQIGVDVDVAGTGAKGLIIHMTFA